MTIQTKTGFIAVIIIVLVAVTAAVLGIRTVGAQVSYDDALDTKRDQSKSDRPTNQNNAVLPDSLLSNSSTESDPDEAFEGGFIDATSESEDAAPKPADLLENGSEAAATEENFNDIPALMVGEPTSAPKLLNINDDGTATIRGVILGGDGKNLLAVKSWGGIWNIRVADDTAHAPESEGSFDIENVPVGHFIGVVGMIAWDAPYTINAAYIRDWSVTPSAPDIPNTGIENNAASATSTMQATRSDQQLFVGTANEIGPNSFRLTNGDGVNYSVTVTPLTIIWSDDRRSINFQDISEGDVVRVGGTISGDVIFPLIIRDTAI